VYSGFCERLLLVSFVDFLRSRLLLFWIHCSFVRVCVCGLLTATTGIHHARLDASLATATASHQATLRPPQRPVPGRSAASSSPAPSLRTLHRPDPLQQTTFEKSGWLENTPTHQQRLIRPAFAESRCSFAATTPCAAPAAVVTVSASIHVPSAEATRRWSRVTVGPRRFVLRLVLARTRSAAARHARPELQHVPVHLEA
jgi:hypothetical protein